MQRGINARKGGQKGVWGRGDDVHDHDRHNQKLLRTKLSNVFKKFLVDLFKFTFAFGKHKDSFFDNRVTIAGHKK